MQKTPRQGRKGLTHIRHTNPVETLTTRWDAMSEAERLDMIQALFAPSRMAEIDRLMMR